MEARHRSRHWAWFEKLWLLAFIVVQLAVLWECYGKWWFIQASSNGIPGDAP
jgi:hypothetical protein